MSSIIWFAITGALMASEVMVGTFYLLALSMGSLAAGFAAHFDYSITVQLIVAVVFASIAVFFAWLNRRQRRAVRQVDDPDVGQAVVIVSLAPLTVNYRGIQWQAAWQETPGSTAEVGARHEICGKQANLLIIR